MTDGEILCTFMEARPDKSPTDYRPWRDFSDAGWWVGNMPGGDPHKAHWVARLNACGEREELGWLHLIEVGLTEEQWHDYWRHILVRSWLGCADDQDYRARVFLHATAAQKIAALASVLRAEVER